MHLLLIPLACDQVPVPAGSINLPEWLFLLLGLDVVITSLMAGTFITLLVQCHRDRSQRRK